MGCVYRNLFIAFRIFVFVLIKLSVRMVRMVSGNFVSILMRLCGGWRKVGRNGVCQIYLIFIIKLSYQWMVVICLFFFLFDIFWLILLFIYFIYWIFTSSKYSFFYSFVYWCTFTHSYFLFKSLFCIFGSLKKTMMFMQIMKHYMSSTLVFRIVQLRNWASPVVWNKWQKIWETR